MSEVVRTGLVEHAIVDKMFRALVAAVDGSGDVAASFRVLHETLRQHIDSEDLDIAEFADVNPEEAKALLFEHERLRKDLDELAADLAAGKLAAKAVHDLKLRFTVHEAREETGFYRWVAEP
jgi:hypothetical protein